MTNYTCRIGTQKGTVNPFNETVSANSAAEAEAAMKSKYPERDKISCEIATDHKTRAEDILKKPGS